MYINLAHIHVQTSIVDLSNKNYRRQFNEELEVSLESTQADVLAHIHTIIAAYKSILGLL